MKIQSNRYKMIIVKCIWILTFLMIFQNSVEPQIIDCGKLRKQIDVLIIDNEPFNGTCKAYDEDSILIISKYSNGKLDGDSAYSRFYKNGLCKSTAKYDNGNLIDFKEFEYYGILPIVGGLYGGYVDRNWLIHQDSVKVGLIKLSKYLIDNIPIEFIVDRADFDISNYNIINFSLTGGCIGGLLIDYSAKSNKITDSMKKSFKDAPHKDYYFYDINCNIENDTIVLQEMHFKLK